ncbi:hypothetical protein AVEN_46974-1, partial [Araneus ventricosus]
MHPGLRSSQPQEKAQGEEPTAQTPVNCLQMRKRCAGSHSAEESRKTLMSRLKCSPNCS